jgi:hypothetical protein
MEIGDWDVEVQNEQELIMDPNNVSSEKQYRVTYSFFYKPTKRELVRTITYIKPHDAAARLALLTTFVGKLKTDFIDIGA